MFKILFQAKFKFSSEIISPLTEASNQGSSTIGNLMLNYPITKQQQEEKYAKWAKFFSKYIRSANYASYKEIDNHDELQWYIKKNNSNNSSVITKTFEFPEEYLALDFISLIKERCDETDYHPSWTFTSDAYKSKFSICIELAGQFTKSITDKDYDIAAFLTSEYKNILDNYMRRIYFKLLSLTFSTLVSYLIFSRLYNSMEWWDFRRLSHLRVN